MPLLPSHLAFTEPTTHADDNALRAMGHSSRCSTAKSKTPHTKAAVREVVQRVEDVSTLEASHGTKFQVALEQDLNAAGILVEVAREQRPISPVRKSGSLSVVELQYTRKCPFTSCAYHLDRGFWSKKEKDHHIMTHFEGHIGFVTNGNRHSFPWPNFIEDPENFFPKIEILKRRVRQYYIWDGYGGDPEDSTCVKCLRTFDLSGYVRHLDDCIVHAVQAEALGTAQTCPVSTCQHDPPKLSWGPRINEPTVKHFVPSLGCSRCYAIQCQCPPMQLDEASPITSRRRVDVRPPTQARVKAYHSLPSKGPCKLQAFRPSPSCIYAAQKLYAAQKSNDGAGALQAARSSW